MPDQARSHSPAEPVTCERHGGPMSECQGKKHKHGDRGSDQRIWLQQYGAWGFGGDTNLLVNAVIAWCEQVLAPVVEHMSQKSFEWLVRVMCSEHQQDADAAAWVIRWHETTPARGSS